MIKRLLTLLLPLGLLMWSCGASEQANNEHLLEAQQALAAGDNAEAKRLADKVLGDGAKELTATQYAELSILYMQLSDCDEMEDNTATAYQCYRNALKTDSAAAAGYYGSLSPDNVRYAQMLAELMRQIDNPAKNNIPDHEEEPE